MAQYVDKAYLQEQFRLFIKYLESSGRVVADSSELAERIAALETQLDQYMDIQADENASISLRLTELENAPSVYVGSSAPSDTSNVWVDTTAS